MRKKIQRLYKKSGANALWNWAKGHGKRRWKALAKWSKARAERAATVIASTKEKRQKAAAQIHSLAEQVADIRDRRAELQRRIKIEQEKPSPNKERIKKLRKELKELHAEADKLRSRIESKEVRRARLLARQKEARDRRRWFLKANTVYRRRLRRARKRAKKRGGEVKYESWMSNGYNDNVTQGVKDFIARGVVLYGLYTTSMKRTYVPPGGSTTSYHLQSPGRAGDIAGARMQEFQIAEYHRNKGNDACLELFGPSNTHNLKYGNHLTLVEGTHLENLHDTHVHGAF